MEKFFVVKNTINNYVYITTSEWYVKIACAKIAKVIKEFDSLEKAESYVSRYKENLIFE